MKDSGNYTSIADLLTDDGFLAWHLKTNQRHEQAWNKWMDEKPGHAQLAKQAMRVLLAIMNLKEEKIPAQQISESFEKLSKKVINPGKTSGLI